VKAMLYTGRAGPRVAPVSLVRMMPSRGVGWGAGKLRLTWELYREIEVACRLAWLGGDELGSFFCWHPWD